MSKLIGILFLVALILVAWSPWLDTAQAEKIVTQEFNARWKGVADGCGPIEQFKNTHRIPFGFSTSIKYSCGIQNPDVNQIIHREVWHDVYISPLMTSYGDFKKAAFE